MDLGQRVSKVVKRSKAFLGAQEPGHFLVNVRVPSEVPPTPPLYDFDLDTQLEEWLDHSLQAAKIRMEAKEGLDDDTIPSVCPYFGIAEHSAWLGMEVHLQEDTSLPIPSIESPEDLDRVELSEKTKWFQYMKRGYEYLRTKKDGTFVLSVRGTMTPMDLANAFRGDALFTDFLLDPEFVHKLMRFLLEAVDWYYRHLRSWADPVEGGQVFALGSTWFGPNVLGHVSNDAAMLCSPAVYEEFGFPYEKELTERYNGTLYHVHNEKIHYVPRLVQLPGLSILEVSQDPKTPPPIEDLPNVLTMTGSANLLLHPTSDQVRARIEELKCRNVFLEVTCKDREDAADVIAFVRDRSKPL
jgi:hypothetical protein